MTSDGKCLIWGTPANVRRIEQDSQVESRRTDGAYYVEEFAHRQLSFLDDAERARLTTWIIDQHQLGNRYPDVTRDIIDHIRLLRNLSVSDRGDRLLKKIAMLSKHIGHQLQIDNDDYLESDSSSFMAWTESTDLAEVAFLLYYLKNASRIVFSDVAGSYFIKLTPNGYSRIDELEHKIVDSAQAFIAMWFSPIMSDFFENGVRPAITAAGYKPFRIDGKHHNNKIDDEIIAEIRRSRFLVADFTADYELGSFDPKKPEQKGARGGVYYEAGFAHGLDIPVIFTCRQDVLERLHFDTRQYNHIAWDPAKLEDFREALENRIAATIGDGPLRVS